MRWRTRNPGSDEDGAAGDPRLLLRLMLSQRAAARDPAQSRQQAEKITAQISVVLARATVKVAGDLDGEPMVGAGLAQTRVLRVFTDDEALQAWAEARAQGEPLPRPLAVGDAPTLDTLVKATSVTDLLLNPAGPGALRMPADFYRKRSGPFFRPAAGVEDHPWLRPDGRAETRRALAELLSELGEVVTNEEEARFQPLANEASELAGSFSDLVSLGRVLWLGTTRDARRHGVSRQAVELYLTMAKRWGDMGESTRCLQALLAGGRVLTALLRTTPHDEWAEKAMRATLGDAERIGGDAHPDVVALRADAETI
jgi:hypothetical protein